MIDPTETELASMRLDDDGNPIVTIQAADQDEHFNYVITTTVKDDLSTRTREEVEASARKWFTIATDLRSIQDQLAADLEIALNAVRDYQRDRAESDTPDPSFVAVRNLLTKYKMNYTPPTKTSRVFVDGVDITEHPDSIEGEVEDLHLTSAEYFGTETAELVADADGNLHFVLTAEAEETPQADTFATEPDPVEPIAVETRDWVNEGSFLDTGDEPTEEELTTWLETMVPGLPTPSYNDIESHKSPEDPAPIFEEIQGPHTPTREEVEQFFTDVEWSLTRDDPDVYLGDHD